MQSRQNYYQQHVSKRVRLKKAIYLLIAAALFSIDLYDAYHHNLPFYYILLVLPGIALSKLLLQFQSVELLHSEHLLTLRHNISSVAIILAVILLRIFVFPLILHKLHLVYISDAILLTAVGWFWGRSKVVSDKIENKAFDCYLQNNSSSVG